MGRIVGFFCRWCGYTAADLAAVARRPLPPELVVVSVPCTGRVGPELVLDALRGGAAGVIVVGCSRGDCHYVSGNLRAERRTRLLQPLLAQLGMGRRLRIELISPSEVDRLVKVVWEMAEELRLAERADRKEGEVVR